MPSSSWKLQLGASLSGWKSASLFYKDLDRKGFHVLQTVQSVQLPTQFCLPSTKQTQIICEEISTALLQYNKDWHQARLGT